jgi:hypothetical protein
MGHDVAPMTSGVANGEHDRSITSGGFGKSLVTPGPPGHRISGMLEKIGACGKDKAIKIGAAIVG